MEDDKYVQSVPSWTDDQIVKDILPTLTEVYNSRKYYYQEARVSIGDSRYRNVLHTDAFGGIWVNIANWVNNAPDSLVYQVQTIFITKFFKDIERLWLASNPDTKFSQWGVVLPYMIVISDK